MARDPRHEIKVDEKYIVTPTIDLRMRHLARMTAARRFPVLLQVSTSHLHETALSLAAHSPKHESAASATFPERVNSHAMVHL